MLFELGRVRTKYFAYGLTHIASDDVFRTGMLANSLHYIRSFEVPDSALDPRDRSINFIDRSELSRLYRLRLRTFLSHQDTLSVSGDKTSTNHIHVFL